MAPQTPGTWRIHAGLVIAEAVCVSALVVEFGRAMGGNSLSWAYVFEWPFFGGYALYMWRSLLREERGVLPRAKRATDSDQSSDRALEEWNRYLEAVHRNEDKPSGDRNNTSAS